MNRWQFEQLIDALDGPDWWNIGITIVNAMIMVWLGISQYKLQKRQTEAQEYEVYKGLYLLLVRIHKELDEFLNSISWGTFEPYYKADKDSLKRKVDHINQLKNDLANNYVDYELKFSKDLFDKMAYYQILDGMISILHFVNQAIDRNEVTMPMGVQQYPSIDGDMEKGFALAIAKRFKSHDMMFSGLMSFIEQKKEIGSCEDVLKVLKKRCKLG